MVSTQVRRGRHRLDPPPTEPWGAPSPQPGPDTVALGWLDPPSDSRQARGRILLFTNGLIAVPQHRLQTGWSCLILASTDARPHPRRLTLPAQYLATARGSVDVDPAARPDEYAAVWRAAVYRTSPGGYLAIIARDLATTLRTPGTTVAALTPTGDLRLQAATGLRRAGVQRLLDRLTDNAFLTVAAAIDPSILATYHLSIPVIDAPEGAQP
jgi:hypothetical protein